MTEWNVYIFQPCSSGLKRQLLYRGLKARSDKAAIDTFASTFRTMCSVARSLPEKQRPMTGADRQRTDVY
jgi:hypothetical protein